MLGLLLAADLGRANQPWVIYRNYHEQYASNPIIDRLREKPYEHRVAMLPFPTPPQLALLGQLYQRQWLKHLFPYYNIQSLDTVQMPRMPADVAAFENALIAKDTTNYLPYIVRAWQLTNTRYLLGAAEFCDALNSQTDPAHPPFRVAERFDIVPKPGFTDATNLRN